MQPSIWDQAWSMFLSAFQHPGLDWRLVPLAAALAFAFGAAWLLADRPPARNVPALGVIAVISACVTWTAIAFLQVPLQAWWGQILLTSWGQSTVLRLVLLAGIPTVLLSGLVQESAKLLPVVAYRSRHQTSFDARTGLLVGAIAGAGFGIFEVVWAHNAAFAPGIGLQTPQADPFAALFPFAQRFFAVGFHIALSALAGYGLATRRGRRFYLAAATLHGAGNYVIVLVQAGLLASPGVLLNLAAFTLVVSVVVLRLRWSAPARPSLAVVTRARGAGAALSILLLLGCTAAPGSSGTPAVRVPHLDGQPMTACTISGEVPMKASVAGYCGTLQVPEDRSNPSGRTIGLRVAVVPATAASPKPDPFFALAGGPGDASTSFFAWLPGLYSEVHASHDIVLVDQRGTGGSNALILPAMPDTSGLSAAEADAQLSAWAKDGLAALDADPRVYTSRVAADDLDDVRAALGYDRIDLYGTSYGGELAQYYLRQHPDHVRVAVLDGTTPLDVPVLERIAAASELALDLLLARCAADPACHTAFPDLAAEWSTLVAAFTKGVTVTDPNSGTTVVADLRTVGPSIHNALLTGAAAAQLPLAIHLAAAGQWGQVNELVPPSDASPSGGPTLLVKDEILCSEAWARFDPAEVERTGAGSYAVPFVRAWAQAEATLCRYLPKGVVPADDAAPVRTDIPVLWLAGDADPQDPPSNLTGVRSQEPNARIVVTPAQEHVVGHLGCGPQVIAAFVDAGTAKGLDTSCVAQGANPAPTFHLP